MGEHQNPGAHFVMVEEKRNILIGCFASACKFDVPLMPDRLAVFVGFGSFFVMEKTLRVLGGDEGSNGHAHGHSHSHGPDAKDEVLQASGVDVQPKSHGLRSRGGEQVAYNGRLETVKVTDTATSPSKLSAYLNLFGDFVHNM